MDGQGVAPDIWAPGSVVGDAAATVVVVWLATVELVGVLVESSLPVVLANTKSATITTMAIEPYFMTLFLIDDLRATLAAMTLLCVRFCFWRSLFSVPTSWKG